MKEKLQHPVYGEIVYSENIWTGRKILTVDGQSQKVTKKEFSIAGKNALVKGNFLSGVTLLIENETIVLSPKPKWYETVLALLPFILLLTWGNSQALCTIFPVVGGAIGGALGGVAMVYSSLYIKKAQSILTKVLIGLGFIVAAFLVAHILALVLILLMIL